MHVTPEKPDGNPCLGCECYPAAIRAGETRELPGEMGIVSQSQNSRAELAFHTTGTLVLCRSASGFESVAI
jgi:hypothetical protein